jgi:Ras-related protein Rab-1A
MNLEYDYLFKILLIGDCGVGKSSIMTRFVDDSFTTTHISTIGVDFKIKTINSQGKIVKLQIWDTAGQERFKTITTSYYRGAQGIIICYDITNLESFQNVKMWIDECEKYANPNVQIIIVANKSDCELTRQISHDQGKAFADLHSYEFFETSAKSNTHIDQIFNLMTCKIKKNLIVNSSKPMTTSNISHSVILNLEKIDEHTRCC